MSQPHEDDVTWNTWYLEDNQINMNKMFSHLQQGYDKGDMDSVRTNIWPKEKRTIISTN